MAHSSMIRVYYDGACRFCVASVERLARGDRLRQVAWVDISRPQFDARAEGIDPTAAQAAMQVRLPDGRLLSGFDGLLAIAEVVALPSLTLLRWGSHLPGFNAIGRRAYRWFARNRYTLSGRCTSDSCANPARFL